MEKLICSACGAPLTPDESQPFITCEYCDTAIDNKYYVAPAKPEPAPQPVQTAEGEQDETIETTAEAQEQEEGSQGGGLLRTLVGVGSALAATRLAKKRTVVQRPAASAVRTVHRTARPQPPAGHGMARTRSSSSVRPARPGPGRPSGGMGGRSMGRGPGPGRPGGRHR